MPDHAALSNPHDHLPTCKRCDLRSMVPEEWATRLDGLMIQRWRCGFCGGTLSRVERPARHLGPRHSWDYTVMARWEGINRWVA